MAATKVKVKKEHVVKIMDECGWHDLDEKSKEWFEDKIPSLKDVLPEDYKPEDDEVLDTLMKIYEGIDEGSEFEVDGDWPALPGEDNADKKKGGKKKKAAKKEKAEGEEKPEKKKGPTVPGVRPVKGRPYCAGAVIKKHGLEGGITDEMIQEIDEMSGKSNMKESAAWAKIAWQVLNGYEDKIPVEAE